MMLADDEMLRNGRREKASKVAFWAVTSIAAVSLAVLLLENLVRGFGVSGAAVVSPAAPNILAGLAVIAAFIVLGWLAILWLSRSRREA